MRAISQKLLTWAGKSLWAAVDQGLFSGANFILNILLARWLLATDYGAFTVALSIFYLLAGFYTALFAEPLVTFGSGKFRRCLRQYIGVLFWGHWIFSAVVALLLLTLGLLAPQWGFAALAPALVGLAFSSPALLFFWLFRRAPYAQMRPYWSALGSGVNLFAALCGLIVVWKIGLLTSFTSLLLLGVSALIAGSVLYLIVKPQVLGFVEVLNPTTVLAYHWDYGRWIIASNIVMWIPAYIYYPLLSQVSGLESSASLRALYNLVYPASQILSAISLLLLSHFSGTLILGGDVRQRLVSQVVRAWWVFFVTSIAYWMLLLALGHQLLALLYAGRYAGSAALLSLLGLLPVLSSFTLTYGNALRALGRTKVVFFSYLAAAIVTILLGVPMVLSLGILGAVLGHVLSSITAGVLQTLLFYREVRGVQA